VVVIKIIGFSHEVKLSTILAMLKRARDFDISSVVATVENGDNDTVLIKRLLPALQFTVILKKALGSS
jgi:hypothetical protein